MKLLMKSYELGGEQLLHYINWQCVLPFLEVDYTADSHWPFHLYSSWPSCLLCIFSQAFKFILLLYCWKGSLCILLKM